MKIVAGNALNQRNPTHAPTMHAESSSSWCAPDTAVIAM